MHKIIFFLEKKICVPTLPKIFRPVTQNTLISLFGLSSNLLKRPRQIVQTQNQTASSLRKHCLIRVFPVCYSDKNYVESSPDTLYLEKRVDPRFYPFFENNVDPDHLASDKAI